MFCAAIFVRIFRSISDTIIKATKYRNSMASIRFPFKDQAEVCSMRSYKLMQRVLIEQCDVSVDGKVGVKRLQQIPSDSLQNPSDPDASYSGHKGQGYQVQVMESFTRTEDKDQKEQTLHLLTHVAVEKASDHDSKALLAAIEKSRQRGLKPKTLLADTLYAGDDNEQGATAAQVELVCPTHKGGTGGGLELGSFDFGQDGRAIRCPAGQSPDHVKGHKITVQRGVYCSILCFFHL